jgi:hypothetical protein
MEQASTPIRFAGSLLRDRPHICAFFNGQDEARRVLLPFIKEALELGEKTLHTVNPRQREEHIQWLTSAGIDVAARNDNGQIEIRDWTDTHLRNGRFDQEWALAFWEKVRCESKSKGFPLVRFITQMEWVLETDMNLNELLEYEAKANRSWLRKDRPVHPVICVYDLRRFRGDIVMDVMRTHPLIIVGGVLHENPFFVPPEELLCELREREANRPISSLTTV